jgi:acetolactate synthase-1/2/3 large subunit
VDYRDIGVALVTSGPGATNTVTGIMTAMMDSVPMLVVCGQTVSWMLGKDAFQEADIFGITIPVVKHNYLVKDTDALPRIVREAYHIATTGRPGPVLIDVPKNISQGPFHGDLDAPIQLPGYNPEESNKICPDAVKTAAALLSAAKRPVILAGLASLRSFAAKS